MTHTFCSAQTARPSAATDSTHASTSAATAMSYARDALSQVVRTASAACWGGWLGRLVRVVGVVRGYMVGSWGGYMWMVGSGGRWWVGGAGQWWREARVAAGGEAVHVRA